MNCCCAAAFDSRCPSMCAGLLYHRQGFVSDYWQLEGEGGGRGRRYSHSSSAKQNWPSGGDCYKKVMLILCRTTLEQYHSMTIYCNLAWIKKKNFFSLLFSEEAEALAKRLKLRFYRASVKEDLNVNEGEIMDNRWNQMKQSFWMLLTTTDAPFCSV